MATIVVDASAVLAVLLNEAHRASIIAATVGASLISPASLPFEVANALSARMKRTDASRLGASSALAAPANFQAMEIRLVPLSAVDHRQALALAGALGIYVYDAYMLRVAQSQSGTLLTLDGIGRRAGLRHQARLVGVPLVELEG